MMHIQNRRAWRDNRHLFAQIFAFSAIFLWGFGTMQGQSWPAVGFDPVDHSFNAAGWTKTRYDEFDVNHSFSTNQVYNGSNGFTFSARHSKGRYSEWFSKDNAKIENGMLQLWGTVTPCPSGVCPPSSPKSYAGAEVIAGSGLGDSTGNSYYGFYESEMKAPIGGGFVAWWLSEKNGRMNYKQHPPEIDMLEAIHPVNSVGDTDRILFMGQPYHYDSEDNSGASYGNFYKTITQPNYPNYSADYAAISTYFTSFHKYGFLWKPDYMQIYIDGQPFGSPLSEANNNLSIQVLLRLAYSFQFHATDFTTAQNLANPFQIKYIRYFEPTQSIAYPKRWGIAWNNEDIHENTASVAFSAAIPFQATANDVYVAGNFDPSNSEDELIWLNKSTSNTLLMMRHQVGVHSWDYNYWEELTGSRCSTCAGTTISSTMKAYSGDFSPSHSGDELLLSIPTGATNTTYLLRYNGTGWTLLSTTTIGASTAKFYTVNYNGTGQDELMVLSTTGSLAFYSFNGSSWTTIWTNTATPGYVPAASAPHYWSIGSADICVAGNFSGDSKDEIMFVSTTGYAKIFNFSGTSWTQLWGAGTPGAPGYNGIGGFWPNPGDKYLVGDWDDDGLGEIFAISPTGQFGKILNFSGTTWTSVWGNNGNGKVDAWWLKGTDKATVGNFTLDPICNANSQLLMIRGELLSGNDKWRGNMYFSPLSQFWSNPANNKSISSTPSPDLTSSPTTQSTYKLFPNPSQGTFELSGPEIARVRAMDINGRVLLETSESRIDLTPHPAGIYFIEVTDQDGRVQILKAIHQ